MPEFFSSAEVERAQRYHRPKTVAFVLGQAVSLALVLLFAFGPPADWIDEAVDWAPWWGEAVLVPAIALVGLSVAGLPLGYWSLRHERRWGFSTRSTAGWWADRARGIGLTLVFVAVPLSGLVAAAHWWPDSWPVIAAAAAAALVPLTAMIGPLVVEPLFNRFRPLDDAQLAGDLEQLAKRAGSPVAGVLVTDASKRTRKLNAYVSGLGRTRRLVLFDTLLDSAEPPEIRLIVAHELGHRQKKHIAKFVALAMAGTAAAVVVYWLALEWGALLDALGVTGPADPRALLFALALFSVLELVTAPFFAVLSRRFEREADQASLDLTEAPEVYSRTHHKLALANLSQLDPPRWLYLWTFSHPTAPERLAAAEGWVARHPAA